MTLLLHFIGYLIDPGIGIACCLFPLWWFGWHGFWHPISRLYLLGILITFGILCLFSLGLFLRTL